MSYITKILPYAVITLDLSTARTNLAQGAITLRAVSVGTWKANTITILTLGGGSLSFRLDKNTNDSIDASDNLKVEGVTLRDIFWTNTAQAGKTAKIFLAWVD